MHVAIVTIAMSLRVHSSFSRITGEQDLGLLKAFTRLQELAGRPFARFAIKVKGRIRFINPADVIVVLAEGNYVLLHQESSIHLLRESISTVAEKLEPFGFIRIHRSVVVNASYVEEIIPYPTGEYGLLVKGGKEYRVSRTYKRNLKALAEFWIGSEGTLFDGQER